MSDEVVRSVTSKRSTVIRGRKTSVWVEDEFWWSLREIAIRKNVTISELLEQIDGARTTINLSSAIRVFVIDDVRSRTKSAGDRALRKGRGETVVRHKHPT